MSMCTCTLMCMACASRAHRYVYLGTLLDSLADIAAGRVQQSPLSLALLMTGGVATVISSIPPLNPAN